MLNFLQQKTGPATRALMALIFVLALGFIFHADGAFYKIETHRDTLRQTSVCGILATGMTMVIITGGIDLSVGSVLAVCAVCFSLFTIHYGWPAWLAISMVLGIGAACGAVSGTLISRLKIQPFIATLALMVFARGLAKFIAGGQKISRTVKQSDGSFEYVDLPGIFSLIDRQICWKNLTVVTVIFVTGLLIGLVLLSRHRWGRSLFAIGGNEEAARLSGVPVAWAKTLAYIACSTFAAVAGICQAAQEQQGDPETGTGYELTAIAMVVIGGTNLAGGRGGMILTLLGVLTIGYLDKILSINAFSESGRLMLTGLIIIVAVLAQRKK